MPRGGRGRRVDVKVEEKDLSKLGGIPTGRAGGSYGSALSAGTARSFQLILDGLEDAMYGLRATRGQASGGWAPVHQARATYLLERQLLAAHQFIADAPTGTHAESDVTDLLVSDRDQLLYRSVRILKDMQFHTGRLFEVMVRNVDVALPGGNGLQIPIYLSDGRIAYVPNHRTAAALTPSQRQERYAARLTEFLHGGGLEDEMFDLTSATFAALASGTMLEYVHLPCGTVRVTAGLAGHLLLARGEAVLCAGQLLVKKSLHTTTSVLYVTNGSGTYKPDLLAAQRLTDGLTQLLGVPWHAIILAKGMPADTQTYKVLLKAMGKTSDEVRKAVGKLLREAEEVTTPEAMQRWMRMAARKEQQSREQKVAKQGAGASRRRQPRARSRSPKEGGAEGQHMVEQQQENEGEEGEEQEAEAPLRVEMAEVLSEEVQAWLGLPHEQHHQIGNESDTEGR
jgi:hypothetical protein